MPSHEVTAAFFGVSLLLAFSPGPDNLFVLAQSAMRGRRAGMLVVLGLCTGLVAHTALVASGLAVVFAASASAFVVLKLIGSAYLLFLAWQAFHVTDARNDEKAASAGHRADTFASDVAAAGVPTPEKVRLRFSCAGSVSSSYWPRSWRSVRSPVLLARSASDSSIPGERSACSTALQEGTVFAGLAVHLALSAAWQR